MRNLTFLLRKEFRQIFRNPAILAISLLVPIVQFLILPLAANFEINNVNLVIVDHDHSVYSARMVAKITGSGYFTVVDNSASFKQAYPYIERGEADVVLEIPHAFEEGLVTEKQQKLLIAINAINGIQATVGGNYLNQIIQDFNRDIMPEIVRMPLQEQGIEIIPSYWFNPHQDHKIFIVPGILAILVTMVGGFLTSLNIVKEKEVGTIEQINVTPIKKGEFILGKLIPFWILANVVFTIGLIVGYLVYDIVPAGSLFLLYLFIGVYLLAVLGFGLLVSTFCETQQQAMFVMFFFMLVFILLGGLFTPIDSMPEWAKWLTKLNPLAYLIEVIRMVMLKGSGLKDVLSQLGAIVVMAVVLNTWAVLNYRKTT